jgi:hypothetical protein
MHNMSEIFLATGNQLLGAEACLPDMSIPSRLGQRRNSIQSIGRTLL